MSSATLLQERPYPKRVSLVFPLYNEEAVVPILRQEVTKFIAEIPSEAEIVLVNDGSTDSTIAKLVEWASVDQRIKVIHLSRNFGHQMAATAGLDHARGEAVVLLDADLQDPLRVVHELIEKYREGYDIVYGQRISRDGESFFKKASAWMFYRIMRILVYKDLPVDAGDFRLMSSECLAGLRKMQETHRFLRGMIAWVGFNQCAVRYHRDARRAGETKYPLRKMLRFAWVAATSFSALPLKLSFFLGFSIGLLAIFEVIRALIAYAMGGTVTGWTSIIVLQGIVGCTVLISLGLIGEYVGKIYEEVKGRPLYLVSKTFNVLEEGQWRSMTKLDAAGTRELQK